VADPSGTYTFLARYIGETQLSLNVDPTSGVLSGGPDDSPVTGQWDDATFQLTFNDAFAGDILFFHHFDGYVSYELEPSGQIIGLAGTYHDFKIHVARGVVEFYEDRGGWSAIRLMEV
jgi:hypothetical protein